MAQRKVKIIIASVAIVGSLASLWWMFRPPTVKYDRGPIIGITTGLGEVLAEETAQAIHDHGQIVVVTDYYREQTAGTWADCAVTFYRELKKHGNVSIVATEVVRPDPAEAPWISCPVSVFTNLMERYAGVDAIVFFIDLPEWVRVNSLFPTSAKAKMIAVDTSENGFYPAKLRYGGYFSGGRLSVLISKNKIDTAKPVTPRTPREWFDSKYKVYTPENYESLPARDPIPGGPTGPGAPQ